MSAGPLIVLENADQRLGLLPELGGSAAFWEVKRAERWCPIWRPYAPNPERRTVANFPLLPWSNRLFGGGIEVDGRFYPMASNRPDSPVPMHGTGWMHAWKRRGNHLPEGASSVLAFPVGAPSPMVG